MPYRKEEFVSLVVRTKADGDPIVLKALRPTAEFYGWTEAFEPYRPRPVQGNRYTLIPHGRPGPWSPHFGGRRLSICRSKSKHSRPRGLINVFRISTDGSNRDLAAIAAATKVEWHWMQDTKWRRIDREQWLRNTTEAH
jgi:hypothetical protein